MTTCLAIRLGVIDYLAAYRLQQRLRSRVADGSLPNLLLLLEHPPVYTLGRRGKQADILASPRQLAEIGARVIPTDRGGEATYHGLGQLVGYPIIGLRGWDGGVRGYVRRLQRTLTRALADFGIRAEYENKPIGVWVEDAKIAAIGIRVSRGVTTHGFALNVCPNLSHFDHIVPCGMPDARATSISRELGRIVGVPDAMSAVADAFAAEFGARLEFVDKDALCDAERASPD